MKAFTRERREVEKVPRRDTGKISIGVDGGRYQDTRGNTDSREEMAQHRCITVIAIRFTVSRVPLWVSAIRGCARVENPLMKRR